MKIKTKELAYDEVLKLPGAPHKNPKKPNPILKWLIKVLADVALKDVNFKAERIGMDKLKPGTPCLILMNHSSFIDLEIAAKLMYPHPFQIVCTSDGFVGKEGLMRSIGCIPTQKFVTDLNLIKDMKYALDKLKTSVLMYPEASYTFDGTKTPLPDSIGKCIKLLGVPVVMITTRGAFARDPLYNMLQIRDCDVSATMEYVITPEQAKEKSVEELNGIVNELFSFDQFKWQQDNLVEIDEDFRADGLNRVLYKCPHCLVEGKMVGKGVMLTCESCNATYILDEYGYLKGNIATPPQFTHVPDWFKWERERVKEELISGEYGLQVDVDICMMVDRKFIYKVGTGVLKHSVDGFELNGCDGKLHYIQKPSASYSLYSDYYWYELGDMICIGDMKTSYYCFPKNAGDVVAKTRLAAEELYKLDKQKKSTK